VKTLLPTNPARPIQRAFLFAAFLLVGEVRAEVTPPLSKTKMVETLRLIEAWDGRSVGGAGEWGPWQICPRVWRQFSRSSLYSAPSQEHLRVASALVSWIIGNLDRLDLPVTPRSVALVYNAGYGNVRDRRILRRHRYYSERASNIYHSLP
jgi:hypothetical protein